MKSISGLPLHKAAAGYIHDVLGLNRHGAVGEIPLFADARGRQYLGGYDNLYAVVIGEPDTRALTSWRRGKSYVRYAFSTERDLFGAKRRHYLLSVPEGTRAGDRLTLYKSKTRNQVRKSLSLITDVRAGVRDSAFYDLYVHTVTRLGGLPRPLTWFERFEAYFGKDVRVMSAYHEGALIGANYYVCAGEYVLLLFNVSDERYWHLDVNNRLYDAYIGAALSSGVRCIDFGPGLAADTSHAHFKEGFGGVAHYMADGLYAPLSVRIAEALKNRLKRYVKPASRA